MVSGIALKPWVSIHFSTVITCGTIHCHSYISLLAVCDKTEGPDTIPNHVDGSRNQVESLVESMYFWNQESKL